MDQCCDLGYGTRTDKPVTRAKQTHNSYKYDTTVAVCTTTVPRQLASPASPPVHIKTDDAPLAVPPLPPDHTNIGPRSRLRGAQFDGCGYGGGGGGSGRGVVAAMVAMTSTGA